MGFICQANARLCDSYVETIPIHTECNWYFSLILSFAYRILFALLGNTMINDEFILAIT